MKVMVTGASPWTKSGYGKAWTYLFPRLAEAGHELAMACFYGWRGAVSTINIGGAEVKFYPPAKDQFFNDVIEYHARDFEADVVITMQDVWTLGNWGQKDFTWCPNFPVDTEPVSDVILHAIEGCHTPLVNTRWAQRQLFERGWMNAHYMPYGVDCSLFTPGDKSAARETLGLPADVFIPGMVAANSSFPSRKSFPEVLQAWRRWLDAGNDGLLYMHTTVTAKRNSGVQLEQILSTLNLDWSSLDDPDPERKARAKVMFPAQYRMWCGAVDDNELADVYRSMDVLLSPSQAEGFGIPIVEAQACGVPVVTLNITAMPELTFAGLCLEPAQPMWETEGAWRGVAGVDDIVGALDWANGLSYMDHLHLTTVARKAALDFDFDVEIERDWLPLLEKIEAEKC
jgi:hypothetical protein